MTRCPPTTETRIVLRTILSAGVLAVLVLACAGMAAGTTWVVDDSGGAGVDYTTIQAAVNAAGVGDTIEVRGGTYYENVDVDKRLNLRGIDTGEGMPVVDAGGSGSAITLASGWITLEGFKVTNSSYGGSDAGIRITSNNNTIKNNIVLNNYYAIHINSDNNDLSGNNVSNNYCGIHLHYSDNNDLSSNDVSNSGSNIHLYYSNDNTISSNDVSNGSIGMRYSNNNTLSNNNVNFGNCHGIQLFMYCNNNILSGNNVSNHLFGIVVHGGSINNTLRGNNLAPV